MSTANSAPNTSYVAAKSRNEAVQKMIVSHSLLKPLYSAGKNNDGKGGWVNAIRDQHGNVYRLLFYIDKLELAPEYRDHETYEVLYGEIKEGDEEPNFPRALYTTTGAINLMRNGLPHEEIVNAIIQGILQIVPLKLGRDVLTERLRNTGAAYIAIYDRDGEGLRFLDLRDYYEIYDSRKEEEIQVRNEDEILIGDTRWVRPFLLKYAVIGHDPTKSDAAAAADRLLGND